LECGVGGRAEHLEGSQSGSGNPELVRAEIAQTVAGPDQVDEELGYLFAVLRE